MVYFNWLGTWYKLGDNDTINGTTPYDFVEEFLPDGLPETNNFVEINYKDKIYKVNVSNIMWPK